MIQEFVHCKKCIADLEKYGNLPLEIYLGICEDYANKIPIFCEIGRRGKSNPIIYFLENKSFIVTTEYCKNSLTVKPNGYREYNKECGNKTYEFCAFRDLH